MILLYLRMQRLFITVILLVLLNACGEKKRADLIVCNARIYAVDGGFNVHQAMAVSNGTVMATGSDSRILDDFESDSVIDLAGKTVLPGLTDAHCHFTGYATDMWKCDLVGTATFEEVLERVMVYAENAPMQWIYGRGWDQNDWTVKDYPDNLALNKLFPDRPVFLKRIDGHAALVNQAALDLAGITGSTSVKGGQIEKRNGRLTGLLIDNAMDLVDNLVPPVPDSLASRYYQAAEKKCFAAGLTQVQDCGVSENTVNLIDREQRAGRLRMKIFALLSDDSTYYDRWIGKGVYRTPKLTVGGFKLYADGALGSRGACLLEPYADKAGWHGFMLRDRGYLERVTKKLAATEFQVCTHAIGDSANREMLHIYGSALGGKNEKRWRIEHAQVVNKNDFALFGKYDIIPSVQPTHATSDMYWAGERLGPERIENAYAYQTLLRSRGIMPLGTDFPVEDISPIKTFYAAVTRRDSKWYPESGFLPEQALTREQALKGMTVWASYAIFEEKKKGSLEKGKAADFVVLDRDIMMVDEREIIQTRVLRTYLDGELVYVCQ